MEAECLYKVSKNYYKTMKDKKNNKPYSVDTMAVFKSEVEATLYKYDCEFHDFDKLLNSDELYDYSVKKLKISKYTRSDIDEYKNYIVECVFNIESNYFCDGYNVLQNNGEVAGQTVFHFHMHLIPRYDGEKTIIDWDHKEFSDDEMKAICNEMKF